MLRSMLGNLVNAVQFQKWRDANPGEMARLTAFMADPRQEPIAMLTFLGGALVQTMQAYAHAGGAPILAWPQANAPLDPRRKDKKPPSSPGGLTVIPPFDPTD
jgi:hypothetical protein